LNDSARPVGLTTIGQRRVQPLALAAAVFVLFLTSTAISNIIASQLGYKVDPLGQPWVLGVYDPFAWMRWLFVVYGPACFHYLTHNGCYVPRVYAVVDEWRALAVFGIVSAFGAYHVVAYKMRPKKNAVKGMIDDAHFADPPEIRKKTTLLAANCGPILGRIQTAKRKTKWFGLVEVEPAKWEHLRDGDSQTGVCIFGVSGAGKTPDYFRQLLLNMLMHPQAETWTPFARLTHPHGYEPNLVIWDLKGSLYEATAGFQKDVLKKNVLKFSPFSEDYTLSQYNPLHFIRLTEPAEFDDCYTAGHDIVDEGQGLRDYWSKVALDFGAAIVATVGYIALAQNNPSLFSHAGVIDYVSSFDKPDDLIDDMLTRQHDPHGVFGWDEYELFDAENYCDEKGNYLEGRGIGQKIECSRCNGAGVVSEQISHGRDGNVCYQCKGDKTVYAGGELQSKKTGKKTKQRQWILQAARVLKARAAEEKSGIFGSFISYVGVYRSEILRKHISGTTFDLKGMANDPERASTVYIVMPDSDLERIRPYFRIMVKDMFRRLMTGCRVEEGREVPGNLRLTRFVLDEVRALNRLEPLAMTAGFMRGHKVIVDLAWQTRSQLIECYGGQKGDTESVAGNLGTHMWYQTIPGADAKYLSEQCGQTTFVTQSRNLSGKVMALFKNQLGEHNAPQTGRNLTEYEACNLGKKKKILFVDGAIIKAYQARYYDYAKLDRHARRKPPEKVDRLIHGAPFLAGIERRVSKKTWDTLHTPPPDRWKDDRDEAKLLPSGCRVRRSQAKNTKTGAMTYAAQVWLPNGVKPFLDESFDSESTREMHIAETLAAQTMNEPQPAPADLVFLPFVEEDDPAKTFALAFGIDPE
jgi:type IV secretory pathway TraG/TraD family ATPase VirD4